MTQAINRRVALYCRISTSEQSAERQEYDLKAFAERSGYEVIAVFTEVASGAKNDRPERAKVMQLARDRKIDAILVTELTRWGRSTTDLLSTIQELADWKISLIAQSGKLDFDLTTASGKLMLTLMAALSEFERGLLTERVNSGLAAARKRAKNSAGNRGKIPATNMPKSLENAC